MSGRAHAVFESAPGPVVEIDGQSFLYFGGTSYLGLQSSAAVISAGQAALARFGLHPATSRVFYGSTPPIADVERLLCQLFEVDAALYTPSGYAGASILLSALHGTFDHILIDASAHYCVFDSVRVYERPGGAVTLERFAHGDVGEVRRKVGALPQAGRVLLLTDGVFALSGDVAPLADYVEILSERPGSTLAVDDAHGVGVLGEGGRGALEHYGLLDTLRETGRGGAAPRVVLCGTTSKALGGYGGFVCGSEAWVAQLRQASGWFAGTSPVPTPVAASTAAALEAVVTRPALRTVLSSNIVRVRDGLRRIGLAVPGPSAPRTAQTLLRFPDDAAARRVHRELWAAGILVPHVEAYSGSAGESEGLLRLAVFADHTDRQIDRLIEVLGSLAG